MKLIQYEFKKITGEKFIWIIIAVLFCINGAYAIFNSVRATNDEWDFSQTVGTYQASTQRIIDSAYVNLDEYKIAGIPENSYAWQYQQQLIDHYERAQQSIEFTETSVRGWVLYFEDHTVNILLFITVILIGSTIFLNDQRSGFRFIMRTTRQGRLHSAVAKTVVWILLTTSLTAAFTIESFVIYGMESGYSDYNNAIQILDGFNTCPFILTLGEYFVIAFIYRLLAMLVMTALCVLVSQFVRHIIVLYLCGIGFLGVNLILNSLRVYTADNLIKHLNLISVSSALPLMSRYNAVNLLNKVIDFPTLTIAIYGIVLLSAIIASILVNGYRSNLGIRSQKSMFSGLKAKVAVLREKINTVQHTYSFSLVNAEQTKTLLVSYTWIAVCLLLLVKCYVSYVEFKPNHTFTDAAYHGYMTELQGPITDEKREWIKNERLYIESILERSYEIDAAYQNLELSLEEYQEFIQQREYAASRQDLFRTIENHVKYIDEMNQNGYEAWFVYDTGWTTLIFSNFDWSLYAAILLICVGSFASEYDSKSSAGGFIQILRTTKYGRHKTYISKILAGGILTSIITIVWNLIDFVWLIRSFDLPLWNAPIHSIEALGGLKQDISISQYLICFYVIRIISSVILGIMVCSLSGILKKHIAILTTTVMITLLPSLLSQIGLRMFEYFDFTSLMQASSVTLQGIHSTWFVTTVIVLVIFLLVCSARKWCK